MKINRILVIAGIILLILLLPFAVKDKSDAPLKGPSLDEMDYSEVTFHNDDITLSGILFLPENQDSYPIAVIIHGSGPSKRDNKWYLSVTQHLQENGIAVLLPDKRGSEKSEGEWIGANFEELATDTVSAIEYAKDNLNYSNIGIIGMSQGGWIAPIVASKTDLDFIVSMSGALVTPEEQLLHEEYYNIEPYTYGFIAKIVSPITAKNLMKKDYQRPFAGFDPIPYWKNVDSNVFIAFGENDKNVPVDESIERLNSNNLDFLVKTYPEGGHAIRNISTNKINNKFLGDLTEFIHEVKK